LGHFRQALRELGYIEGRNITFEYRVAGGQPDRLATAASDLVDFPVDIIVVNGSAATRAAQQATAAIPIVMTAVGDPVGAGFVQNLGQPGGNITGIAILNTEVTPKRVELLKELVPNMSRVAFLWNSNNPSHLVNLDAWRAAAPRLGIEPQFVVGAAGFLLGGGIGFNMRRFGMGCDAVLRSQIVTADGRIRTLSPESDSDLFWATRGGAGGNFGVSTQFTLKTQPVDKFITVFRFVWRANTLEVAKARISLGGVTPDLGKRGRQVPVTLLGQYAGPQEELMAILASVFVAAKPEVSEVKEVAYWEGQNFLLEPSDPAYFRERSAFLRKAPDAEFLGQAFETLQHWTGTGAYGNLFFFQTGGKINEVASDATAFVHRDSRWLSVVGIYWSKDDVAKPEVVRRASDWQDGFYNQIGKLGGAGAFQSFPDSALVDWRARYYGANYDRLLRIKQQVDPTNIFQFAQAI
jgi:ABC transporter substrate binding protein/Berberine and berberine like